MSATASAARTIPLDTLLATIIELVAHTAALAFEIQRDDYSEHAIGVAALAERAARRLVTLEERHQDRDAQERIGDARDALADIAAPAGLLSVAQEAPRFEFDAINEHEIAAAALRAAYRARDQFLIGPRPAA